MENNTGKVVIIIFAILIIFAVGGPLFMVFFKNVKLDPIAIVLIIIGFVIAWVIFTYNKLVKLKQGIRQASGGIDIYLKQRFDLIPNLVETVKAQKNYESSVIEEITKLRTDYETRSKDIASDAELNNRYTKLIAVVEAYPELKTSEAFVSLQKSLSKIESQLQAARRIYNTEVTEYNMKRQTFPSNVVAGLFGFKEETLFEIDVVERENIKVKV